MPEYNIKISELNQVVPTPPFTEDFFPLVHSASMTTYRATIQDIGSLMTHSIYADTASYTPFSDFATSASYAKTASYAISSSHAISASHALLADSASYYPPQIFQTSCSWASRSLQSWYATRSIDVDTHGQQFYFPWWNTANVPGTNGALEGSSTLFFSRSWADSQGPIVIDPAGTFLGNPYYTRSNAYPWFSQSGWWNASNMAYPYDTTGLPGSSDGGYIGGLFTPWPIVSGVFVGTDKKGWVFTTTSSFGGFRQIWTGSFVSGGYIPLTEHTSFDSIMNGKWLRIAVTNTDPEWPNSGYLADNVMPFEGPGSWMHTGMFGRIRIIVNSTVLMGGSNQYQSIDLSLQNYYWSGEIQAIVHHAEPTGLVRAIRITDNSEHYGPGNGDPFQTIDVLLDTFNNSDYLTWIMCESWGGVRFMNQPVLDPPPLSQSVVLQFPPRPGFYSLATPYPDLTYNFSGRKMIVDPSGTEVTQSGMAAAYPYSLNVSGGVQTNTRFYCDDHAGLTTKVTYGTTNLYFSGGILIDKYPPDTYVPPVGTACGGTSKFNGGQTMPASQIYVLGSDIGPVEVKFDMYAVPDRAIVVFDGINVMDTGYRGDTSYQTYLNNALATYGSASSPITSPGQGTMYWYKNTATTTAQVLVFAPIAGTAWNFTMSCPNQTLP